MRPEQCPLVSPVRVSSGRVFPSLKETTHGQRGARRETRFSSPSVLARFLINAIRLCFFRLILPVEAYIRSPDNHRRLSFPVNGWNARRVHEYSVRLPQPSPPFSSNSLPVLSFEEDNIEDPPKVPLVSSPPFSRPSFQRRLLYSSPGWF